jgi:hypothetical protein
MSTVISVQRLAGPSCPFTEEELSRAHETWRCNCGPATLACMLGLKLADVRDRIPGFRQKGYTNPTMMHEAIRGFGLNIGKIPNNEDLQYGICRIQFDGPWCNRGVPPGAAYRCTHWVGALHARGSSGEQQWVYDCNSGWVTIDDWSRGTALEIAATFPHANGSFFPTHKWELIFPPPGSA